VLGEGGGRVGEIGNPTELSILRASYFAGIDIDELRKDCPIVAEVPFSSEYKFMATVHEPALDKAPAGKTLLTSRVLLIEWSSFVRTKPRGELWVITT
jgi:magnesium-transporting ATPase (P-type)